MAVSDGQATKEEVGSTPVEATAPAEPTAPSMAFDVENQSKATATARGTGTGAGVAEIVRRWKREDIIKRGSLALRGLALLFSLLSFIIMASNNHGDWKNYDKYEEYRYLLAIGILSTVYTGLQALRLVHELSTRKHLLQQRTSALLDFFGDQIMAYLLISAASSAVPLTNRIRESADNLFSDTSAASISMAFLAFFALALSAMISGYKLSTQSYV